MEDPKPVYKDGVLIGYTYDGKTMIPVKEGAQEVYQGEKLIGITYDSKTMEPLDGYEEPVKKKETVSGLGSLVGGKAGAGTGGDGRSAAGGTREAATRITDLLKPPKRIYGSSTKSERAIASKLPKGENEIGEITAERYWSLNNTSFIRELTPEEKEELSILENYPAKTSDAKSAASGIAGKDITSSVEDNGLYPATDPKKYETKLNPQDEQKFQSWLDSGYKEGKVTKGDYDFYKKNGYGYNYDFRAAFIENQKASINKQDNQYHWGDVGKKPNHPTFSKESKYNGVDGYNGGTWDGEKFIPPKKSAAPSVEGKAPKAGIVPPIIKTKVQEAVEAQKIADAQNQPRNKVLGYLQGLKEEDKRKAEEEAQRITDFTPNEYEANQKAYADAEKNPGTLPYDLAIANAEQQRGATISLQRNQTSLPNLSMISLGGAVTVNRQDYIAEQKKLRDEWLAKVNIPLLKEKADKSLEAVRKNLKENFAYVEKEFSTFTTKSQEGDVIPDPISINNYAKSIAKKQGLNDEGYYKNLLYNEITASVAHKIIEPKVLSRFEENYKKKYGKTLDEETSAEAIKGFTEPEKVIGKAKIQVKNIADQISVAAKQEVDTLNNKVTEAAAAIKSEYEMAAPLAKTDQEAKQIYDAAVAKTDQLNREFLKEQNLINSKYNARYRRQVSEIERMANAKIQELVKSYKYERSPELQKKIQAEYQQAYKEVIGEREALKEARDYSYGIAENFGRAFVTALGGAVKGISSSFGFDAGKALGDYMNNMYQHGSTEIKSFLDFLDPTKLALSMGSLGGGMMPSIIAAAATSFATGGGGTPAALRMLYTGLASWSAETADIAGRMYEDRFAETGSAAVAEKSAKQSFNSQVALMPFYAFDGLPFMGKAVKLAKNIPGRILLGGTIEVATELLQEYPQNLFEEAIKNDKPYMEGLKLSSAERFKQTFLNIAPVFLMGGGGQAVGAISEARQNALVKSAAKSFALKSQFEVLAPAQREQFLFDMMQRQGNTFTAAYAGALFAGGKITEAESVELTKIIKLSNDVITNSGKYGLDPAKQKVYAALAFYKERALKVAGEQTDPLFRQAAEAKVKNIENDMVKLASGEQVDYIVLTYPNNEQYVLTTQVAQEAMKNEKLIAAYKAGDIKIATFGKRGAVQEKLDEVDAEIKAEKKKQDDDWKANIVAIGNRTDITEKEKERLKDEEDKRHAEKIAAKEPEARPTKEIMSDAQKAVQVSDKAIQGGFVKNPELALAEIAQQLHSSIGEAETATKMAGIELADLAMEMYPTPEDAQAAVSKLKTTPKLEDQIQVGDMVDKVSSYKGERGYIRQDGQTLIFQIEGKNKEYELGNVDELYGQPLSKYGISIEESVVEVADSGNIKVRGVEYLNNYSDPSLAINRDKEGNVVSVNLETADGKKRTFRGNIAEDIAYQIYLQKITQNNETESFENFINETPEIKQEIDNGGFQETTPADTNESAGKIQREKISPVEPEPQAESTPSKQPGGKAKGKLATFKEKYGVQLPVLFPAETVPTDEEFKNAEQILSILDAEKRFSDGDRIFAQHELDEGGQPFELTSVGEIRQYTPDAMIAIPRKEATPPQEPAKTTVSEPKAGSVGVVDTEEQQWIKENVDINNVRLIDKKELRPIIEYLPNEGLKSKLHIPIVISKAEGRTGYLLEDGNHRFYSSKGTDKLPAIEIPNTPLHLRQKILTELSKQVYEKYKDKRLEGAGAVSKDDVRGKEGTKEGDESSKRAKQSLKETTKAGSGGVGDVKVGKIATKEEFNDAALNLATLDLEDSQVKYPKVEGREQTMVGSGNDYNLYLLDRDKMPESGPFEISIQDDNGEPIGFIRGTKSDKTISINLIHLQEENRGKGIGTDIYEKLLGEGYTIKSDKEITDDTYSLYDRLGADKNNEKLVYPDGRIGIRKAVEQSIKETTKAGSVGVGARGIFGRDMTLEAEEKFLGELSERAKKLGLDVSRHEESELGDLVESGVRPNFSQERIDQALIGWHRIRDAYDATEEARNKLFEEIKKSGYSIGQYGAKKSDTYYIKNDDNKTVKEVKSTEDAYQWIDDNAGTDIIGKNENLREADKEADRIAYEEESKRYLKTKAGNYPNSSGVYSKDNLDEVETVELPNKKAGWKGGPDAEIKTVQLEDGKWIQAIDATKTGGDYSGTGEPLMAGPYDEKYDTKEEAISAGAKKILDWAEKQVQDHNIPNIIKWAKQFLKEEPPAKKEKQAKRKVRDENIKDIDTAWDDFLGVQGAYDFSATSDSGKWNSANNELHSLVQNHRKAFSIYKLLIGDFETFKELVDYINENTGLNIEYTARMKRADEMPVNERKAAISSYNNSVDSKTNDKIQAEKDILTENSLEDEKAYSVEELVSKFPLSGVQKVIYNLIKNVVAKLGIKVKFSSSRITEGFDGSSNPSTGEILIRPSSIKTGRIGEVLIHEVVHALTTKIISRVNNGVFSGLTQSQINAVKGLMKLYNAVKSDNKLDNKYPVKDVFEFIAHLTNDDFVKELKAKDKNFIQKLVDAILDILGINNANSLAKKYLQEIISDGVFLKENGIIVLPSDYSNPTSKTAFWWADIQGIQSLDPKRIEAGTRLIGAYIKAGVYKFSDILEDAYAKMGDKLHEVVDALKAVYSAFYNTQATDEQAAKMDANLRNINLQEIINRIEEGLPSKVQKTDLPENVIRSFIDSVKRKITAKEKITIQTLRKMAGDLGLVEKGDEVSIKDTELQEMVELGIVELARDISLSKRPIEERFKDIVELYNSQPTISMRSSERIAKQQYSTPIPISFLMGEYLNLGNPNGVLEPNAGNGMLTIAIPPGKVWANEIDPVRLKMLQEQGFKVVTSQDAIKPFPLTVDAVIMNPPFGSSPAKDFDGYSISGLDEQMVINALHSLNSNGRAAFIMGGHNRYDEKGRLSADRVFFNYLYNHYNVSDVINIDGSLYAKQGTSFPIRVVLIDGVKSEKSGFAPLEDKATSAPVTSFDELYQRVQKLKEYETDNRKQSVPEPGVDADIRPGDAIHGTKAGMEDNDKGTGIKSDSSQDKLLSDTKQTNEGKATSDDRGLIDDLSGRGDKPGRESDTGDNADGTLAEGDKRISEQQPEAGINEGRSSTTVRGSDTVQLPGRAVSLLEEKVQYKPKSGGKSVDTVIPAQMATETYGTLDAIEKIYGNIDDFVAKELEYEDHKELFKALSAEQIDAVAIAIHQLKNGQGMIIGDMTGVGKGRIAAAIIRYAVNSGQKPIFLTEKPNLFSDLYRDLVAIGSADLKPFIVNTKSAGNNPDITDAEGRVVYKSLTASQKAHILAGDQIPNNYDFTVTTYSQVRTALDKPSVKRDFFLRAAQDNIIIMDESHNASGASNSGALFQEVLPRTKGVVFLSATFAKRPDNMPVYAMKTAMADAQMSQEELVAAIERGGVALQEVVSANLVQSGQMLRRERTFDGVKIEYDILSDLKEEHRKTADGFTSVVRDIIKFEKRYVLPVYEEMDGEMAPQGGRAGQRIGTDQVGVDHTPFANKTFNLINQMLFSIKAKEIAQTAIRVIKEGKKPVISFLSTMESFLDALGVSVGERLDKSDFALVLKRGLDGTMRFTINGATGVNTYGTISLSDLSPEGQREYQRILADIRKITSGVSISPIDTIIKELTDAGLTVGEITGRKRYLEYQSDGSAIVKERKDRDKNKIVRQFNGGSLKPGEKPTNNSEVDVLLLNQSGATGLSAHASETFKDQRPRVMINGQFQLDVNTEVQVRGRIDRTGQVVRGEYRYVVSDIPAEQRLLMMFKKKLKSLDANTTSSQKSKGASTLEVEDFMNKYGDEIVTQYLKENSELNEALMDPLSLNDKSDDDLAEIKKIEKAANKVTGRVAILPTKEQEAFYKDIVEAYISHMKYLEENNENDLEVKLLPLNAETKKSEEIIEGRGTNSPFGMPSVRETIEVDVLTKPMKAEEIDHEIKKLLEGKTPKQVKDTQLKELSEYEEVFIAKKIERIEKHYADEVIPETLERAKRKDKTEEELKQIKQELEAARDNRIERERVKYENVFSNVEQTMRFFNVGDAYRVPVSTRLDTNTFFSNAIFMGLQIKENATNKYTPSNIVLKFAVNDSRRIVTVPASKTDYINGIIANSRSIDGERVKSEWDSRISNKARQNRYIITGNLLQAYGTNDGQLISYTTIDGKIKKGLLQPESYEAGKQKYRTTISKAFTKAGDLMGMVDKIVSTDGDVSIERERGGGYSIAVPTSKARGGKYFLNDAIRDLVQNRDFRTYAGKMEARVHENNIRELLLILDSMGVTVESEMSKMQFLAPAPEAVADMKDIVSDLVKEGTASLKEIQQVVADELGDNSKKMRDLVEDAYHEYGKSAAATQEQKGISKAVAKQIGQTLSKMYGGSVEVLNNEQAVIDKADELGAVNFMNNPDGKILGFAHAGNVYLNGEHLNPNTPIHEAGHIWVEFVKANHPEIYERGIELLATDRGNRYLTKVKSSRFYSLMFIGPERETYFQHEALAMAIGDKGAQFVTEATKKGFREWLRSLWDAVKKALGFKGITAEELQNLTFDEFTQRAARDILSGGIQQPAARETVGVTIADLDALAEDLGLPDRYEKDPQTEEEWDAQAKQNIEDGKMPALIAKLEKEDADPPTAVGERMILQYIAGLKAEYDANPSSDLLQKFRRIKRINNEVVSRQWGQLGKALQGKMPAHPLDGGILEALDTKMESLQVDELTDKQMEEIEAQVREYEEKVKVAEAKIAEMEAKMAEMEAQAAVAAMALAAAAPAAAAARSTGRVSSKKTHEQRLEERDEILRKARQALKDLRTGASGLSAVPLPGVRELIAIAPHVKDYVKSLAGESIDNLKAIILQTQEFFEDLIDLSEKDVIDILAGKYNEDKKVTETEAMAIWRDLQAEAKLLHELNNVKNGVPKTEKQKRAKNVRIAELQKELKELKKEKGYNALSDLQAQIRRNQAETNKIKDKISRKDFAPAKQNSIFGNAKLKAKYPKEYQEMLDSLVEKENARHDFDIALHRDQLNKAKVPQKIKNWLGKLTGTFKSIVTGIDDSAVAIQTYTALLLRPKIAKTALKFHAEFAASQKKFDRWLIELHNAPDWDIIKASGLSVTEPQSLKSKEKEEIFDNRFNGTVIIKGKKYKLIDAPLKPFERAFTTLGNVTRVLAFRAKMNAYYKKGYTFDSHPELFKSLANRLNTQTGRADLNKHVDKFSKILTLGIWSPKLMASKFNLLGVSDLLSLVLPGTKGYYRQLHPLERKQAIKDTAQFVVTVVAISYLTAILFGGELDDDPLSPTFMNVKFPNGRSVNFTGGFSSYFRTIFQAIRGRKRNLNPKMGEGEYKKVGTWGVIGRFFQGKMPPLSAAIFNTIAKKDFNYKPTNALREARKLITPISIQGIIDEIDNYGAEAYFTQGVYMLLKFTGFNVSDQRDYDPNLGTIKDPKTFEKRPKTQAEVDEEIKQYNELYPKVMQRYRDNKLPIYVDVNSEVHLPEPDAESEINVKPGWKRVKFENLNGNRKDFESEVKRKVKNKVITNIYGIPKY